MPMPRSPQNVTSYGEADERWEHAQHEARHLQALLAAARQDGCESIKVAKISQELNAAHSRAAQFLAEATQSPEAIKRAARPAR